MLGKEYKEGPYTEQYIKDLLLSLADMGPDKVILTGVNYNEKELGAATYDKKADEFGFYAKKRIKGYYHGTGDVFGSALLSAMMKGKNLIDSAAVAVDFTVESIIRTYKAKTDIRFGVNFEEGLQKLAKLIKKIKKIKTQPPKRSRHIPAPFIYSMKTANKTFLNKSLSVSTVLYDCLVR
jgi:pyridoxine kinase